MLVSLIKEGFSDPKLQFWIGRVLRAQRRHVEAELHLSKAAENRTGTGSASGHGTRDGL